jgi:hypothetical protein
VALNYDTDGEALLNAIEAAGKFVALDLSGCALSGTVFNPKLNSNNHNGKAYILSLVLPNTAKSVTKGAGASYASFKEFSKLKTIEGSGITGIDSSVFSYTALTTVNFPEAASIGTFAFQECTALTTVNLPKLASIVANAFYRCTALTTVYFPECTSITGSFQYCTALTMVNIPKITAINALAFAYAFQKNAAVTFIMGSAAPTLAANVFQSVDSTVAITVRVPAKATGYDATWTGKFKNATVVEE